MSRPEISFSRRQILEALAAVALGGQAALTACSNPKRSESSPTQPSTSNSPTTPWGPPTTEPASVPPTTLPANPTNTEEPQVLPETTQNIPLPNPEQINGEGPLIYHVETTYDADGKELIVPPDWFGPIVVDLTSRGSDPLRWGLKNSSEVPALIYHELMNAAAFQRGMPVAEYIDLLTAQNGANVGIDTELVIPVGADEYTYPDVPTTNVKPVVPIDWKKGLLITDDLDMIPKGERIWSNLPETQEKGDRFAIIAVDGQLCFYFPGKEITRKEENLPLWRIGKSFDIGLNLIALALSDPQKAEDGTLFGKIAWDRSGDDNYDKSNPFGYIDKGILDLPHDEQYKRYEEFYISKLFGRYPPTSQE